MAIGCLPFFVMLLLLGFAWVAFGVWGVVYIAAGAFVLLFIHNGTR